MCYYEQTRMVCGDFKWGNFKAHCSKEYRTGETCGMKLVYTTHSVGDKCKTCQKIDTKNSRIRKEQDRINRWVREGNKRASIEQSENTINSLSYEVQLLQQKRQNDAMRC